MCDLPARRHAQESRPGYQGRSMSASYSISPDKLSRLIGTAAAPALIDEDFSDDSRLNPGPVWRSHLDVQAATAIFRFNVGMLVVLAASCGRGHLKVTPTNF